MMFKVDVVIPVLGMVNPDLLDVLAGADWVGQVLVTREKPLSVARKHAVERCGSEWVAMFDADMYIPPNWLYHVRRYATDGIGAVATVAEQSDFYMSTYEKVVGKIKRLSTVDSSPHINNILIKREVMRSYAPPKLFYGEDQCLKRHVESLGLKWKVIENMGAVHLGGVHSKVDVGITYKRYSHYSPWQLARRFLARFILVPYVAVYMGLQAWKVLTRENVEFFAGWLKEAVK